ncbi:histidinol-phosphatase [Halarsenatibacter silvermanii]|uniref:Histidinol-phosphatase n=1 Tax=Halarsenatibacter silvermanii TaxID=321763 RepID=A0A1G9NZE4_9FIRM|nr:histidinol-phosphatase [Halarsenatibacter silvermanii]SDL91744.1 histidinol-phosphatase (PHP family) [Halarsenatibacter silvermanii]
MSFVDWHTHPYAHGEKDLRPCQNKEILKKYVDFAREKGLRGIGFTDHDWFIEDFDFDNMYHVKEKYELEINIGIEFEYIPGREGEIEEILHDYPLEYSIGSVHQINGWEFDNPEYKFKFEELSYRQLENTYQEYFNIVKKSVESDLFDIVGHLELLKIFDYSIDDRREILDMVDPVLKALTDTDTALEINTNGLNKPIGELFPALDILKQADNYGVRMVYSSDAHAPERTGENFEFVDNILKIL